MPPGPPPPPPPPPYDARIDYLESSGTQYIDTGIVPSDTLRVKIRFKMVNVVSDWNVFFGTGTSDSPGKNILARRNNSSTSLGCWFATGATISTDLFDWHTLELYNGHAILDGTDYTINSGSVSSPDTMFLFAGNNGGVWRQSAIEVSEFSLKDGNDYLIDLIPVVKNSVGYMYDKVSGQLLGNAGSGEFILGPDID